MTNKKRRIRCKRYKGDVLQPLLLKGRRDRRLTTVVLGALTVLLVGVGPALSQQPLAQQPKPTAEPEQNGPASRPVTQPDQKTPPAKPYPVEIPGGVEIKQAPATEAREKASEQRSKDDLEAQKWMAISAIAQAAIGLVGLLGLAFTVWFARKAWKSAELSVEAGRKANEIAQRIGEDQLRGYVLTAKFEVTRIFAKDGSTFQVAPHFEIKNVGQTPAFNVRHFTRFAWMTDEEAKAFVPAQKLEEDGMIGPGLTRSVGAAMGNYEKSDLTDGRFAGKRIWIKGVLHFDDATGVRWEHRFCWYLKDSLRLVDSEDVDNPSGRAMDFNMTAFTGGNTLRRLAEDGH